MQTTTNLERFEVFHEIGHALIAYIFNGYCMNLKQIVINKDDIKSIGLHKDNLAYTQLKNTQDCVEKFENDKHTVAAVVGLTFLGGIAGATYLCPEELPKIEIVTPSNFKAILNVTGSSGDFEFIDSGGIFYTHYLFNKGFDKKSAFIIHSKLMNILQEIYLNPKIREYANLVYQHIVENPNQNIELTVFEDIFPKEFISEIRNEIENKIRIENIGEFNYYYA